MRSEKRRRRRRLTAKTQAIIAFFCMVFLMGLTIFLWPQIMGVHLGYQAHVAISEFFEMANADNGEEEQPPQVSMEYVPLPTPTARPYADLYRAMCEYNEEIYLNGQSGLTDAWAYEAASFDLAAYGVEDGAIGVINIPKMDVELPIFLGATSDNMARGAVHLSQTSLPIGGINTNCVIAAHRGWYGAPYFRYIDTLQLGDFVYITNLWETLTYQVTKITVIDPDEIDKVLIQPGKDMVTLVTCHPYASGGLYRYIVYCERVNGEQQEGGSP